MRKEELVGKIRELANEVEDMEVGGLDADTISTIGNLLYNISNEAESISNSLGSAFDHAESAEDYAGRARSELESIGTEDLDEAINDLRRVLEEANAIED